MGKLSVEIKGSFMGNVVIITDKETSKNVELMSVQLKGMLMSDRNLGGFPHADWVKEGESFTVYHNDNQDKHEITFTESELLEALQNRK